MTHHLRTPTAMRLAVACLLALPTLAACGSDDGGAADSDDRMTLAPADSDAHGHDGDEGDGHSHDDGDGHSHGDESDGHDHGDMGDMPAGDPDATPAHEIPDAELREGHFHTLDGAPQGSPDVGGHAWLARTDDGTTVSIDVTGLEAGTDYTSHLHAEACEPDAGGDHFKFDPQGSDQPPNEVHLAFTADDEGRATTTVTNEHPDSQGAKAMVLHLTDGTKFACADLAG